MSLFLHWVTAISSVVAASAILLAYLQFRADHKRSRRELSITLLESWVQNLTQRSTAARKLVDEFSEEQAKTLLAQEPFSVKGKYIPLLRAALKGDIENSDDDYNLSVEQSSALRWEVIDYLNSLEVVLSAWNNNIADQKMLEEQFRDLVSPEKDIYLLKNFRKASGGASSFPCIEEFVDYLGKAKTPNTKGYNKII
ncbi:hypothetical protein [uncultured Salinisphaera sp.]|uniref:hypothetical protein n=1 Tax=uncultured Salinisphaera sp. TaxID=359372 RepID=UPI0032B21099|tara:strand:+ start:1373 stop:1963 length:591 start_codon:yes stop_codon:yes gene_type:complete